MRGFTTQLIRELSAAADHRSDGDLLGGFLTRNVESDFAELVRRHGSMVWGVCRRGLPDRADAEDAFQTVFLVLVRRGNKLVEFPTVGPWLHRVATWTVRNVRRRNAHRLTRRATLTEDVPTATTDPDLSLDLDDALLALPEKFRSSIVLCHLMGFSRADAAAQLGCPEGTLSAWLSRGLAKLRTKLGDHDPARMLGLAVVAPTALSASVVRAAVACRVAAATAMASTLSSAVPQLIEGVLRMFWVKKATAATISLFAVFAFGVGVGLSTHQLAPAVGGQVPVTPTKLGVSMEPPGGLELAVEEKDLNAILADLENQLKVAESARNAALDGLKVCEEKIQLREREEKPMDPKDLQNARDTRARFQEVVDDATKQRDKLTTTIGKLQEYRRQLMKAATLKAMLKRNAQPEVPTPKNVPLKAPQIVPDDVDQLMMAALKKHQAELQAEAARLQQQAAESKAKSVALELQLKHVEEKIAEVEKKRRTSPKDPAPTRATGAYFQLTVGTKDATWPFLVKEFGPDGKPIGTTAFENAAVLGRFLARAVKDPTAPKEVRMSTRADTPPDFLAAAIDACKAAGVAQPLLKAKSPLYAEVVADEAALLLERAARAQDEAAVARKAAEEAIDAIELSKIEELRRVEMLKAYTEAIRRAEELLKKQKPAPLPGVPKP